MKIYKKTISYAAIMFLLISTIFPSYVSVSAEENVLAEQIPEMEEDGSEVLEFPDKIEEKEELTSKRTETSKTFLNPDGTLTSETYTTPIHWKDDTGKWHPIKNKLVKNNKNKKLKIENESNNVKTKFPETIDEEISEITIDNYSISFAPSEPSKIKSIVEENSITYKNIYKHVDFIYHSVSSGVKEDIVLKNKNAQNSFEFILKTKNVEPVLNENNAIDFIDKNNEVIFTMPAPYAYDANENFTTDIKVSLKKEGDNWLLTQTLDEKWMNESERKFPITIDPTVQKVPKGTGMQDGFVYSAEPTSNFSTETYLRVGHNGYGQSRTYLKFNVPQVYSGAQIQKAELFLEQMLSTNVSTEIGIHEVTSNWTNTGLTWNNQPTFNSTPIVKRSFPTAGGYITDVTSIVKGWYDGTKSNYGIVLKATNEDQTKREFRASESYSYGPHISVTYKVDDIGSESFWSFDNGINLKNGNYVVSNTDVGLSGRGVPIVVTRTYNSKDKNNHEMGYGWVLNTNMKVQFKNPDKGGIIVFYDDDGTKHHFTMQEGKWTAPPGIDLELTYSTSKTVITDKSKTAYEFNTSGQLVSITDSNKNVTKYAYNTDGTIKTITDASGRFVTFTYTNGKLTTISGNEIITTKYSYDSKGDLIKVEKLSPSGTTLAKASYEYDANHNLIAMFDNADHKTSINYFSDGKVKEFVQTVVEDGTEQQSKISYTYKENADGSTTIDKTNAKGIVTRFEINDLGNLTKTYEDFNTSTGKGEREHETVWDQNNLVASIKDPKGNATIISYDSNNNVSGVENPKGNKVLMKYDKNNNLTQTTGFAGETLKNYYDENNNVTSSVDESSTTNLNNYDSYGNLIETSREISMANNLVLNSGFEKWQSSKALNWAKFSGTGGMYEQTSTKYNGERSIGINTTGKTDDTVIISDYIPINGKTTYNASFYAKTTNNANAKMIIRWYSDTSTYLSGKDSLVATVKGNTDWLRRSAQVQSPDDAIYARITFVTNTGTAWYDNVQFEEGSYINEYNYITNGDFETDHDKNGKPDQWNISNVFSIDSSVKKNDKNSLKITGNHASAFAEQKINYSGKKGAKIRFGGYSKASGVSGSGTYQIKLAVQYTDDTYGWYSTSPSTKLSDWQYLEKTITAQKDFKRFIVQIYFQNMNGTAWFDDVFATYSATENAVTSNYNLALNPSFEYIENNKTVDWTYSFQNKGTVYNVKRDEDAPVFIGESAMFVSGVDGWSVITNNHFEPIVDGKSYTFSAMTKAAKAGTGTGKLKFDVYDSNNQLIGQIDGTTSVTADQDWKRIYVNTSTKDIKAKYPAASKIKIAMVVNKIPSGHIYFDAVRFEEGSIIEKYQYDSKGNYLTKTIDIEGDATNYTLDKNGDVTKINFSDGVSYAEYEYDELERVKAMQDSGNLRVEYGYDNSGNVVKVDYYELDANKNKTLKSSTKTEYNEFGEMTKSIDAQGNTLQIKRDINGNITDTILPNGKTILNQYNRLDEVTKKSYVGDSTTWEYKYDKNGNFSQVKKNGTEITDYTFDSKVDEILKITYPSVNGVRNTFDFTYDASGEMSTMSSSLEPGKTRLYNYYLSGLGSSVFGTNSQTSESIYDEAGNISKIYSFDGTKGYNTYFEYDDTNEIERLWRETSDGVKLKYDDQFSYDKNGNLTQIVHSDGSKVVYTYDSAKQLKTEKVFNKSGTLTNDISYTYDVFGNRKSVTKNGVTSNYTYNNVNELVTADEKSYSFDENGNQLSDGSNTFEYDAENQLTSVKDQSGSTITSYEYADNGSRSKKVVNGKTEYYYYVHGMLTHITDEKNKLKYSFTYNANDQLLTMTDHTGTSAINYFYELNYRGDVIALRDSSGNEVVNYEYDSFGNITSATGDKKLGNGKLLRTENPFRYASYYYDEETQLYYLNSRYYDPKTGRFLTKDSMPSENAYIYAENDPINNIDVNGAWSWKKAWNKTKKIAKEVSGYNDVKKFIKKPSLSNALWAATAIPILKPLKVVKYAAKGIKSAKSAKKSTAAIGLACSFTAGTTVQTPDGDKPIEEIEVGDLVLAKSDATGELAYKQVVELFPHEKDVLYELHLDGEILKTTEEHPFWVENQQQWVATKELKMGDTLVDKSGNELTVRDIIAVEGTTEVFNFEVEDFHTYFVGEHDVWTHNACGSSAKLRKNMVSNGKNVPKDYNKPYYSQAHHIVPSNPKTQAGLNSRNLIESNGIDINSHYNGVFLPSYKARDAGYNGTATIHKNHGSDYEEQIWERLEGAEDKHQIINILDGVAVDLLKGKMRLD